MARTLIGNVIGILALNGVVGTIRSLKAITYDLALRRLGIAILIFYLGGFAAPAPPLVCPAGGPIGSVDLRVTSPTGGSVPLPLRTINRLEEGDTLLYRPILRSGAERTRRDSDRVGPREQNPCRRKAADFRSEGCK